jgi:UDP:flavonoid glycosyltransferase YjiC (YdhE family)
VPQVVLPMWLDLYNYAQLVEQLGVGVYATRRTAPEWTVKDLSKALLKVLDGGEASLSMKKKSYELSTIAQRSPGRDAAAKEVARLAQHAI